jgi:hypothetical protein
MFHTVCKHLFNERKFCAELRLRLKNTRSKSARVQQVLSVGRYAPRCNVFALSPQETSSKEIGSLRLARRHILHLRMQLGDRQQGKLMLLPVCSFS